MVAILINLDAVGSLFFGTSGNDGPKIIESHPWWYSFVPPVVLLRLVNWAVAIAFSASTNLLIANRTSGLPLVPGALGYVYACAGSFLYLCTYFGFRVLLSRKRSREQATSRSLEAQQAHLAHEVHRQAEKKAKNPALKYEGQAETETSDSPGSQSEPEESGQDECKAEEEVVLTEEQKQEAALREKFRFATVAPPSGISLSGQIITLALMAVATPMAFAHFTRHAEAYKATCIEATAAAVASSTVTIIVTVCSGALFLLLLRFLRDSEAAIAAAAPANENVWPDLGTSTVQLAQRLKSFPPPFPNGCLWSFLPFLI